MKDDQTVPDPEIEQMVRWLCVHENHFTLITSNVDVCIYSACMGPTGRPPIGKGPTLRSALESAVATVRRQEQHTITKEKP